ncbi:MAG: imidazoleglycerol-phosphate dehydratase, partial [Chloroflexota bacterium]
MRNATIHRATKETEIKVSLSLEGKGTAEIDTGLGFLDHMLSHLAVHGCFDLQLSAQGDLEVDEHHTVEDCALALGQAFDQALGDRKNITRVGWAYVPMDETLARVTIDLSGRPYSVIQAQWATPRVGGI